MVEDVSKFAERQCPACGRTDGRSLGEKGGHTLVSCRGCATMYASHLPLSDAAYDYDGYYCPENLETSAFNDKRLDEIVAGFSDYRKTGRLLDIGCGAGSFMKAAARAGWTPVGVEVSRPSVEHVESLGFEVFCGELSEANYPDDHFDVVIASEVLEHVPDPQALARAMARVLRPGGLLWATTPHGRGISAYALGVRWSVVSPPEHLHLFSVAGIRRLLKDAGFSRTRVDTHGTNPFEIIRGLRGRRRRSNTGSAGTTTNAAAAASTEGFDRVQSSHRLNEFLSESPSRKILKGFLNGLLNAARLGDSLKIRAEK